VLVDLAVCQGATQTGRVQPDDDGGPSEGAPTPSRERSTIGVSTGRPSTTTGRWASVAPSTPPPPESRGAGPRRGPSTRTRQVTSSTAGRAARSRSGPGGRRRRRGGAPRHRHPRVARRRRPPARRPGRGSAGRGAAHGRHLDVLLLERRPRASASSSPPSPAKRGAESVGQVTEPSGPGRRSPVRRAARARTRPRVGRGRAPRGCRAPGRAPPGAAGRRRRTARGEAARVAAALDRHHPQRRDHLRVGDPHDALGAGSRVEPERRPERRHGTLGRARGASASPRRAGRPGPAGRARRSRR
jgi:hypothetical protein